MQEGASSEPGEVLHAHVVATEKLNIEIVAATWAPNWCIERRGREL